MFKNTLLASIYVNKEVQFSLGLVLWHINLCSLFNAKSIFM